MTIPVPNDLNLAGAILSTQAVILNFGSGRVSGVTNGLDLQFGIL